MEVEARDRLTPPPYTLANPAVLYALLWLSVVGLFQLRLLNMLQPIGDKALALVLGSVASMMLISAAIWALMPRLLAYTAEREVRELEQLYVWRRWALWIWGVGTMIEIVTSRGLPLVWILIGDHTRDYRDFGIFSVHGLMMALYFSAVSVTAVEIFLHGRTRRWRLMTLLLCWPVALMSRGSLMMAALEIVGISLLCRRVRLRAVAVIAAGALVGVILFGVLGDVRGSSNGAAFEPLLTEAARPISRNVPSGFLWVYLYTTTPFNNIVGSIESLQPSYQLYFSVAPLMPTIVRGLVYDDPNRKYPLGLVSEAFNTSTWFVSYLADFGIAGAIVGPSILLLIISLCYRSARAWRPWALVGYGACFQALLLSAFADTFTSLVTIAQLLFVVGLQTKAALRARQE